MAAGTGRRGYSSAAAATSARRSRTSRTWRSVGEVGVVANTSLATSACARRRSASGSSVCRGAAGAGASAGRPRAASSDASAESPRPPQRPAGPACSPAARRSPATRQGTARDPRCPCGSGHRPPGAPRDDRRPRHGRALSWCLSWSRAWSTWCSRLLLGSVRRLVMSHRADVPWQPAGSVLRASCERGDMPKWTGSRRRFLPPSRSTWGSGEVVGLGDGDAGERVVQVRRVRAVASRQQVGDHQRGVPGDVQR